MDVVTRALETLRTRWLAMGMKLGQVLGAYLTVVHGVFCILYRTIAICSGVAVHVRRQCRNAHFGLLRNLSKLRRCIRHFGSYVVLDSNCNV